jgi:hypothetical protein
MERAPLAETAARSLKVTPSANPVRSDGEIEMAIAALGREPGGGLVVMPDSFMTNRAALLDHLIGAQQNR